ncbi:MAG: hypothetical protein NTX26_01225 [Candidatus Parcubacteria bacterium]|nr:hypothetical protein [Candidatus Parcubacteria bacterium]
MNIQRLIDIFSVIYKSEPYTILAIALLSLIGYFIYNLFLKKSFLAKKLLIIGTIICGTLRIVLATAYSVIQGLIWGSKDTFVAKALTPPFTPFNYIASYTWIHFLKGTIFTIIGAIGLFYLLKLINKLGHDRFFYEEEYWLATLGCLAVGWPNLILYFFISTLLNVLAHIVALAIKKEGRISLLYMWPIAMIITIIFGDKLALMTNLIRLKP